MQKRLVPALLAASLLLNAMAVGGFLYARYYAAFHFKLDAVAERLDLDAAGRQRLLQFRHAAWRSILDTRQANAAVLAQLNRALADRPLGDPAFSDALDSLGKTRRARQEDLVARIVAFRDSLPPDARRRFGEMAADPGFVFELLGLRLDNAGS